LFLWAVCTGSVAEASTIGQQGDSSKDSKKPSPIEPSSVFKKLEPVLREATTVPLRLSAFLPYVDEEHPIFTNASSVDNSHREISLGWIPECEGKL